MSDNRYMSELLKPNAIYRASWHGWIAAIKLTFWPFLLALVCDIVLALLSHLTSALLAQLALRIFSVIVIFYFLMFAFYLVHCYWQGDSSRWQEKIVLYSKRFLLALVAFALIFAVTFFLIKIGARSAMLMLPYAHLMGQIAAPMIVSIVGLLAIIWVVICFYWPFYIIRDGENFGEAIRKSFTVVGLAKTAMIYVPVSAFVLLFLITSSRLPWMHWIPTIWYVLTVGFLIKWLLGAWVVTMICLMMKQADFMLVKIEEDLREKKRQRDEKKNQKKNGA